jgi:N-acetylmuramoyl-L-alanine amidase
MANKIIIFSKLIIIPTLMLVLFCSFLSHKDDPKRKVRIIVIDAGHGGKDPGCAGVSCKEKEVALSVALKLGKLIEENIKDVKVIFTRKTDVFVELEDRAKIANDNNADLFISIHCNAAGKAVMVKDKKTGKMRPKTFRNSKGKTIVVETANPEPFGSETYVMGLKNEEGKMKVAQRENSAMLLEDNYETKYQGFDPNSEESYIIMSNYTSSYVIQSAGLAMKIQEQYSKKAGRVDKGVHRQSIWVLWRTSMPSVLTEIGYLTNPNEEKFLGSDKGQSYLAACLFRALRKYKDEQEGIKITYKDDIENQVPLQNENYKLANESELIKTIENPEIDKDVEVKKEGDEKTDKPIDKDKNNEESTKVNEKLVADQKAKADSIENTQSKQSKIEELEKKHRQFIALADVNYKNKNYQQSLELYRKALALKGKDDAYASQKIAEIELLSNPSNSAITILTVAEPIKDSKTSKPSIIFKVQFASSDQEVDTKIKFANVPDVSFYKVGLTYKYTSGNYNSMNEAKMLQTKIKELGYTDCFVVAFNNGSRMDINEAKKLTEKQ